MFDLFRSRDKAVRIFLTALLSLVPYRWSRISYGYGGSGAPSSTDTVIAEVGKHKVTIHDVSDGCSRRHANRDMPPSMMAHYVPQMIDQMINEKAMIYQASRMGLKVTETEDGQGYSRADAHFFPTEPSWQRGVCRSAGPAGHVDSAVRGLMQDQILLNRLRSVVLENTVVSKTDIEREFRLKNEKATIEYVKMIRRKSRRKSKSLPKR